MSGLDNLDDKKKDLRTVLFQAVLNGHLEAVEMAGDALVQHFKRKKSVGPQALDFHGSDVDSNKLKVPKKYLAYTSLMMALEEGKIDIAKKLVELGASVAFRSKQNHLGPLHIASNRGQADLVDMILEKAQNQKVLATREGKQYDLDHIINGKKRPEGWTPLMYAAKNGHQEIVKSLMGCGKLKCADSNKKGQNAVHIAGKEGQLQVLQDLHEASGDDQRRELFLARDKKGWNVLHHSCARGHVDILKWLLATIPELKTRECLNQESENGYTPLLVACEYSKEEVVQYLLEDQELKPLVDVYACTTRMNTGLHLAAIHDTDAVARLLIKGGCPMDAQDANDNTALHIAVEKLSNSVASVIRGSDGSAKLDQMKNKDEQIPNDLSPKEVFIIPVEIEKRGPQAKKIYIETLREGRRKIPRCKLLILGQERTGKTSLYHQLVGKQFQKDLDPTRGIDNKIVDTVVDVRQLSIEEWQEKDAPESGNLFSEEVANLLRPKIPDAKRKEEERLKVVPCERLKQIIRKIISEIEELLRLESEQLDAAPVHSYQRGPFPSLESYGPLNEHFPTRKTVSFGPSPIPITHPVSSLSSRSKPLQKPQPQPPPPPPPSTNETAKSEKKEKPTKKLPLASKPPPGKSAASGTPTSSPVISPSTPTAPAPPPSRTETLTLGRKHNSRLNQLLKKRADVKYKDPSLVLNTLDFAGQKEYRPMHHCFISRRSLYLAVFKAPDMVKYIEEIEKRVDDPAFNPFEELRYWLHSIHAHIICPTESSKEEQNLRRVLLVGTHKRDCASELDKIKKFFDKDQKSRYRNHIHRQLFFVENSIDKESRGDKYLAESGTKDLQDELKETTKDLPFLKEDHPVIYFYLEDCIEYLRISSKSTPVVDVSRMREVAKQCGLGEEEEQDVAFQFFHDTGKILWLKNLPRLFLADNDRKELEDLVILHRPWIFDVMKVIMELSSENIKILPNTQIDTFDTKGVADLNLLKVCWTKFTNQSDNGVTSIEIRHLCLILKAYCLIFPIRSSILAEKTADSESNSPDLEVAHAEETSEVKYLIPCKLPELTKEDLHSDLPWFSMHFDFCGFLPAEIYHRLVCLLLATAETDPSPDPQETDVFTSTVCLLHDVKDCHWKVKYERNSHKLIVAVLSSCDDKLEHIKDIHKSLSEICKDSSLEGLKYYGGPLEVKCSYSKCSKLSLPYVSYGCGQKEISDSVICKKCKTKTNIRDELARLQHDDDASSKLAQSVDTSNFREVHFLLEKLDNKELRGVGASLGLHYHKLKDMGKSDIIHAWLNGDDNVMNAAADGGDSRTWGGLISALESEGHRGIAKNVKEHVKKTDKKKIN